MNITIEDIANIAQVSKSTVSRVLNKSESVSKVTKKKVMKVVKDLNYRPNQVARSLATQQTCLIGIIVPDIRNPFYSQASWFAEKKLIEYGYVPVIFNTDNNSEIEKKSLEVLKDRNVDGIISIGGEEDLTNIINFNIKESIPIILLDRKAENYNIPSITVDNIYGGEIVTEYLIESGHTKIIFATSDFTQAERQRKQGFIKAYLKRRLMPNEDYIFICSEEQWKSASCIQNLLNFINKSDTSFTAIFASNDFKAFHILKELKTNGLKVPGNISLVGYDDINFSTMVNPKLTTVSQPIEKMVSLGANMLEKMIKGDNNIENKVIRPRLVKRESVKNI
ncbi:MAG: LacI family DNA-binding transcriptional regulator [Halothermotrichaceae bacterium]